MTRPTILDLDLVRSLDVAEARIAELEKRLADAERVIEPGHKIIKRLIKVYGNMEDGDGDPCPDIRDARSYMEGK